MSGTSASNGVRPTRVAVIEQDTILRYGLVACLAEDERLEVTDATPETLDQQNVDIAVVSSASSRNHRFGCPIIIYGDVAQGPRGVAGGNVVAGVLSRGSLTVAQLHATVHAAVAGLRVNSDADSETIAPMDARDLQLVELIADGYSTREIADRMSYSERTIKKLITDLSDRLHARSRPQIVAQAIRRGLI
jgi:DNA-binding NarL/FixJ family response regulator